MARRTSYSVKLSDEEHDRALGRRLLVPDARGNLRRETFSELGRRLMVGVVVPSADPVSLRVAYLVLAELSEEAWVRLRNRVWPGVVVYQLGRRVGSSPELAKAWTQLELCRLVGRNGGPMENLSLRGLVELARDIDRTTDPNKHRPRWPDDEVGDE